MFKRRRSIEIILLCVRWHCKYGISYGALMQMMKERGVEVDPSTIMRWAHRYAPELKNGCAGVRNLNCRFTTKCNSAANRTRAATLQPQFPAPAAFSAAL